MEAATLLKQLAELGILGIDPIAGGRTRIALTDDEKAAPGLLVVWMSELELDVRVDRIGNIFGTLRSENDECDCAPLMLGSHIDTVKNGGRLDRCYGVLAGLAVARALRRAGLKPRRPITIAAFTNEEGVRYQPDMMCSLVYADGLAIQEALASATDGNHGRASDPFSLRDAVDCV